MAKVFPNEIITISLPPSETDQGTSVSFNAFEDIAEWFEKERVFWSDLFGLVDAPNSAVNSLWKPVDEQMARVINDCRAAISILEGTDAEPDHTNPAVAKHLGRIESNLPTYKTEEVLLSSSAKAKYISALDSFELRLSTYAAFSGKQHPNPTYMTQGHLEAYRFRNGPEESSEHFVKSLEDLASRYEGKLGERNSELRAAEQEARVRATEFESDHESRLDQSYRELTALKSRFESEIAVRTAVEYWEDKQKAHRKSARIFVGLVAFWVLTGVVSISLLINELTKSESPISKIAQTLGQDPGLQVPFLALGGVLILLYVWIMRLFVRFLLSDSHLATDAGERKVATQVFLALIEDSSANIGESERAMFFERLIMPASLGMIKDEATPPSIFGAATRRMEQ